MITKNNRNILRVLKYFKENSNNKVKDEGNKKQCSEEFPGGNSGLRLQC